MSSSLFQITEHVLPCQHIREYRDAVKSEASVLQLAIKEYRPLNNLDAESGSVTIIAISSTGLPKETYEPLWDDLYHALNGKIRAIWIADSAHQGASGVWNENIQGNDPHWFDHSRDLLGMVNYFRDRMIRPIFGIAQSMGTAQLVQLSLMHPRLFYSIVLMEPVIGKLPPDDSKHAVPLTSFRQDLWPSRAKAEQTFRKNPFFRAWDPRVLDMYLRYNLRSTPTAVYPDVPPGSVTLTTTKHQEAWSYARPNYTPRSKDGYVERLLSPQFEQFEPGDYIYTRGEATLALHALPHLRPSVLWIFGKRSNVNFPGDQQEKMACTGTGLGGSGGAKLGMVEKVLLTNTAHMVAQDKPGECAASMAYWFDKQIQRFHEEEAFYRTYDSGKSERGSLVLSRKWLDSLGHGLYVKRPHSEKL